MCGVLFISTEQLLLLRSRVRAFRYLGMTLLLSACVVVCWSRAVVIHAERGRERRQCSWLEEARCCLFGCGTFFLASSHFWLLYPGGRTLKMFMIFSIALLDVGIECVAA